MKWVTGRTIYEASFHAREMESGWIRNMKEGGHTLLQGSSKPKNPDFLGKTIKLAELKS
jgi:fructose-specific component phosphotransferase system IIB-like protein